MRRALAGAAIAALLGGAAAAQDATDQNYPEIVRTRIADFDKSCKDAGGTPGPRGDKGVVALDIDGDGRDDWMVDYRHFVCAGAPHPYCAGQFCAIDLNTWRDDPARPRPILHAAVASWRAGRVDGHPALILIQSGEFCGMKKKPTCTVTYTFVNGTMRGRMK